MANKIFSEAKSEVDFQLCVRQTSAIAGDIPNVCLFMREESMEMPFQQTTTAMICSRIRLRNCYKSTVSICSVQKEHVMRVRQGIFRYKAW